MDIYNRLKTNKGPLGQYAEALDGYFTFPKLEGEIGPRMKFRGSEKLVWSLNNYLGLANDPEVRKVDAEAAAQFGNGYPMGARMMSGNSDYHEQLEVELASFVQKESAYLLNYGYQGCVSIIDSMLSRHDIVIYDAESHACIIDGVRLHQGKRFTYSHNDIESLEKQLQRANKMIDAKLGGILVITEGVFGMRGTQGKIKEIIELKKKYDFRLFVDDAHGFGALGETGAGTGEEQHSQDGIDLYFSTFAKSMASIGAFVAGDKMVIDYLRYNMRSQIFAKSLPMPLVIGDLKRLEILRSRPELRTQLWTIVNALQSGLRENGMNIGITNTPVTPVFLSGTENEAINLVIDLRENYNLFCSPVVYPVIPRGEIMLRLIPTASHSLEDVKYTVDTFIEIKAKLEKGLYAEKNPKLLQVLSI
ncbi:MAG: aminotransferase class I/II-fold pyridoxal phosphate-dependent enzyme [Bacteroidota bacterium]|nr:aminotransferase class I/II-fold pyridoxal phosphate-dependent enzyme [Bacteroidota bacterium]